MHRYRIYKKLTWDGHKWFIKKRWLWFFWSKIVRYERIGPGHIDTYLLLFNTPEDAINWCKEDCLYDQKSKQISQNKPILTHTL